ncbi:T9SS type A sorting domain-containing protein [Aquimarina sp. MMG016]|uniref:T9SS type A sorting domain-containing protein n=1 Tax=Aquimarina sp. MMG016 TaxID=2822690 RepID=UPI001B39F00F|nr:T9SS type A sorting domain-containing protein [Aquimarina sp. MMG016]MBQ4821658.1 T9SS type A sorting domain-containing protein [Aquimarina sp. MMG016]
MFVPLINWAQTAPLKSRYETRSLALKSKGNQAKNTTEVITETVSEKGATWLRLFLENVNLGKNSSLTITSDLDGATQTLTSATIKDWKNTTAYFNGDKITLKLTVAAGEKSIGFNIKEIGIGELDPTIKSQCGSRDDRVDSNDAAIGRIVPIGCTGWIITNGKLVTAGHCVGSRAQIIEFNVPKSNPDRTIVHPGPEDQYPIGNFVSPYPGNASQANDWAVFEGFANSQTGLTPIQGQGASYNVVRDAPGANITITGFGTDTGIDNQTQQIHTGPLSSSNNTFVRYRTDTTGGNSGSPIIDAATGNAVGVHAYGGCSGSGGSNSGERATIPAFWNAMGLGTPPPPPPSEDCTGNVSSFPYAESFESSLGAWKNATSGDDIDWTRDANGTPSNNTGPSSGADGSFYLYVEASGNGTGYPNKRAILNSPCLNFNGLTTPTLTFQYHMFGSAINSLTVEARTDNTGNWTSVFNKNGAQGSNWNTADVDLSAYDGEASVQLRFNVVTGSGGDGWQSDIAIDAVSIQNGNGGPGPDPDCAALNLNDFQINPFSNQDRGGTATIVNGGAGLSMQNNTWKEIALNYTVTANTVVEFDFSSSAQGEIHAIGFEDDDALTPARYFKVHGTQNYGVTNYDNYAGGTTSYVIPVGNFYTGTMNRFVFINDDDVGSGNTSIFSNVKIYEGSCAGSLTTEAAIAQLGGATPTLGTEGEDDFLGVDISPNPTNGAFSIRVKGNFRSNEKINATIYNILGSVKAEIGLKQGVNTLSASELLLPTGIYLVKVKGSNINTTQKLIIR